MSYKIDDGPPLAGATHPELVCLAADSSKYTAYTSTKQAPMFTMRMPAHIFPNYILHAKLHCQQTSGNAHESADETRQKSASCTLYVLNRPTAAVSPPPRRCRSRHLSAEQQAAIRLADLASAFMVKRRWPMLFVTIAPYGLAEDDARQAIRAFKSRITDCQRRGGQKRRYYIEDLHAAPGLHAHLLVAANDETERLIRLLADSEKFKALEKHNPKKGNLIIHVEKASLGKWFTGYAAKDLDRGGRVDGSFIRLSAHLRQDMVRAGIKLPDRVYRQRKETRQNPDIRLAA